MATPGYRLFVGSAEWTGSDLWNDETGDLYVKVTLDGGREAHRTIAKKTPYWNEDLNITGDASSIISFEIKNESAQTSTDISCIGHVEMSLEALLEMCADGDAAGIEFTLMAAESGIGLITVELQHQLPDDPIELAIPAANLQNDDHTVENEKYALLVGATEWNRCVSDDEFAEFYVEITLEDPRKVNTTKMTESMMEPSWYEEIHICGESLSTIYFEIMQKSTGTSNQCSCIGRTEVLLEALLTMCADDEFAALEMTMIGTESQAPGMGYLTVKLRKLADPLEFFWQRLVEFGDVQNNLGNLQEALQLLTDAHPDEPCRLSNLGITQITQFEHLGELSDLESGVTNLQKAVELTEDGHPSKPGYLSNVGNGQLTRFERLGELSDLESAIVNHREATDLTDDVHPKKPGRLSNLGNSQLTRFKRLDELSDMESAIMNHRKAADLTDYAHPHKPMYLSNLGNSQRIRFDRLGELSDLENAIVNHRQAANLTDDAHPQRPMYLSNLGNSRQTRFDRLGELSDLESAIMNHREAVNLTDDAHTDKPGYLSNLGNSQRTRFEHLSELSDLESAFVNHQEAANLTDDAHPHKPGHLSNLGICQVTRFERFGELSDLESAIMNHQEAANLTDDAHPSKPGRLSNLGISQVTRFERLGELSDLESAIVNHREAANLTDEAHPHKPMYLCNLGNSQRIRFDRLGELSDLESAIVNHRQSANLTDDAHPQRPMYLSNLGNSQRTRFDRLGELSDLESAIVNHRQATNLTDDAHPHKPGHLSNLGNSQLIRFERLGELSDLESAIMNHREAVNLTDDAHPSKPGHLSNLGVSQRTRFDCLGELSDLESAIVNHREAALNLTDDAHTDKPGYLSNLGNSQQTRFDHLGELSDLESAIVNHREAVNLTNDAHPDKPGRLSNLGSSQLARFERLGELSDRMAAVTSFKSAAQSPAAYPRRALTAARSWARLSQTAGDLSSAFDAYRTAIEIMPQVAWLGLDTASRQRWLSEEQPESLGCLAATCAIQLGRFEEAVELLELARSVFWQQASSVRSDLGDLKEKHPELAKQLESVSRALDANSFFDSSVVLSDTRLDENRVRDHCRLVLERELLIARVRTLPDFEFFLKPTPFHQLRPIAGAGHVVIINVSTNGADALIFDNTHPIQHVPLPDVDLDQFIEHSRDILSKRPSVATAKQQKTYVKQYLRPALRAVGEDIIAPIFNTLRIPLQSGTVAHPPSRRILWYPTGPLTFIPIHAAGPGGKGFDVSRLVVSSSITTLGSLVRAQKKHGQLALERPKLLIVSQPHAPGQSPLPQCTAEIETAIQVVSAAGWLGKDLEHLNHADATVDRVSNALNKCSWVHFACHGLQGEGMDSALALYDGHLDLAKIASKRLSSAQLAFLSACQTASGMRDLPGEAMHLAAGIQFAGFLSVIATMWSICDDDGPIIAEHTYRYLLRNGLKRVDVSESAAALNYAVLRLREDPTVTVDRWAPFIHLGI